jgi:hypothetical protein
MIEHDKLSSRISFKLKTKKENRAEDFPKMVSSKDSPQADKNIRKWV